MGKLTKFTLILLLLVLPLTSNKVFMPVPAVVTLGGGELVQLEVEIKDGSGEVYFATDPLVGIQTQDSARTAFAVARKLAGVGTNYDVLVHLKDHEGTKTVDGPSGGAAMTLLMLSILKNKTIRRDLTITGTILKDGSVGDVGEVGKKTKASVSGGMRVILIPKNSDSFDKMVFSILGSKWNISIIEVSDIGDVQKLAFTDESVTLQSNVMEVKPNARINLTATEINCTMCHMDEFKALVAGMININHVLFDEVSRQNKSEFAYFLKTIESDIGEAKDAENWNYVYSGANSAFLTRINLNFLKDSNITYDALRSRMANVESCVRSAERPQITMENFEWVAGGDERRAWAKKKLREISAQNYSDDDETILFLFKELITAETWCNVSHEMFSIAERIDGAPVNENNVKEFASSKIAEADSKVKSLGGADFGDAGWRFDAAKEEFDNGSFVASIFDSEYIISTIESINETKNSEEFFEREFGNPRSWNGMWAALYGNHAEYIYLRSKQGSGGAISAVILQTYANSLDNNTVKIIELFQNPIKAEPAGEVISEGVKFVPYENELALLLIFCLIVAIFLNLVQIFKTTE